MNMQSANVCLFPVLISVEASENQGTACTFNVTRKSGISLGQLYAHGALRCLPKVEVTLVHAVWAIILNLYTRNSDFAFGTNNGESIADLEDLRVFQSTFDENGERLSVAEWLQQLSDTSFVDTDNQKTSYTGDQCHQFNTSIFFSNKDPLANLKKRPQLAVYAIIWLDQGYLDVQLNFSSAYFEQDQGQHLANQFVHIARSLIANLDLPLNFLNWTPEEEKSLFLHTWQLQKDDYNELLDESCIHHLFERQVERTPNNIALQFEDKEVVTYSQLNLRSNRLAHYLINLGVGPETIVPVCFEKSINMVVALLAILKAGGAYVPLDPEYPKERVSFIVNETKATICLTTRDLMNIFDECSNPQLILIESTIDEQFARNSETNPVVPRLISTNLSYLIFTSGSTGVPKGVMIEHRAAVNYINAHQNILNLCEDDRYLQFSNYTFDASILDFFVNLTVGSRICLASKNNLLTNLAEMARLMSVTAAQLTTTVAGLIRPHEIPTLRMLQQGGEMMTRSVRDSWAKEVDLHNGYGPTETTVYTVVRTSLSSDTACNNIGWPIGRNKAFILNDQLELVPLGAIGEICFSGPQMARGYLNRPDLTKPAFINSPFTKGERLYKTGDLGRYNPDGSIVILGRKDNQIKLNGLRIELDEVEHALHQCSEVAHASVRLISTARKSTLVAFVTFQGMVSEEYSVQVLKSTETSPKIAALQESARKTLPQYMIPTVWVPLNRIPINTSGKTDSKALEAIFRETASDQLRHLTQESNAERIQPSTQTERVLQKAWADVLNIDPNQIGTTDSFYHLGGDSISAIQVSSMCRQMGVKISVQRILEYPTIHQLSNYAEEISSRFVGYDEADETTENNVIPLTPIQSQYFGVEQSDVNHFHLSWLVRVKTPIRVCDLKEALKELTVHHAMLRVRFTRSDGCWRQQILPANEAPVKVTHSQIENLEELKKNVGEIQRSLNLESGPISSFALYDLPNGDQLLFMTIHHYIIDLVSWRVIWEDLESLLRGESLSYRTLSFKTWSGLLRSHAESLALTDWPVQTPIVPLDIDISKLHLNTMDTVQTLSFSLQKEHTDLLFSVSNDAYRTEAVDFMLSSLAASYCKTFNAPSLAIATEGHGREPWDDSIDISRTIGWFTTIYPVNISVNADESIIDVLVRTKDLRKIIPHRGFNYGLLRYLNEKTTSVFAQDHLQVGFNYLGRFQHLEKANSLLQDVTEEYSFDLNMIGPKWRRMNAIEAEVTMKQNNLHASISFSNALHSKEKIHQWLQSWRDTLSEAIVTCANTNASGFTNSDLPLLSLTPLEVDLLIQKTRLEYGENFIQAIEDIFPCSSIQEGLIIGNMRSSNLYHVQDVYELVGHWDFEELYSTWNTVIQDIPIMRTVFINNPLSTHISGTYLQVVLKQIDVSLDHLLVQSQEAETVLQEYLTADVREGFPLGKPNIRICLMEQNDGRARMIISRHHAINDGWSDRIVMKYLSAVYNKTSRPTTIPFRDFIQFHILEQKKDEKENKSEFWNNYLLNVAPCALPKLSITDSLAEEQSQLQCKAKCNISMQDLKDYASKTGITTSILFQAAWGLVLHSLYGMNECTYGTLVNGRNIEMKNIDQVIGPCIDTLPLRVIYDGKMAVSDWLQSLYKHTIASIPFQHVGLQTIKQSCKKNGAALEFDSLFNFQLFDACESITNNTEKLSFELQKIIEPTEYSLVLSIYAGIGGIDYRLDYDHNVLMPLHADLILGRLDKILKAIISTSQEATMDAIAIVSDYEMRLILSYSGSSVNYIEATSSIQGQSAQGCIHTLFEEQVIATPNNIAVQFEHSEFVTYSELNIRANRLSHYLTAAGVGVESLVPLCFDKSIEMVVAMLAVNKAGGAYVPLDPANPNERNHFIIKETNATVILTTAEYTEKFAGLEVTTIVSQSRLLLDQSADNPVIDLLNDRNLCYIIFTSGTTGTPKGAMLEHASVVNYMLGQRDKWNLDCNDNVLQFASYTFDASVIEILCTLISGARVCMASKESLLSNLAYNMESMRITCAILTPTVAAEIQPESCPSLTRLISTGEMMPIAMRDTWAPHVQLINAGGPTESAVMILYNDSVDLHTSCSNLGRPLPNNKILILDSTLRIVPLGAVGELCVSGIQLARGYLNRPDLTANTFVDNPFAPGERLYLTGDLAKFNHDGTIELVGRKGNQIKLHGLRIELEEIEHIIHQQPGVSSNCVLPVVINQETNHRSLVAFIKFDITDNSTSSEVAIVTGHDDYLITQIEEIRGHILSKLPPYMMPNAFVPITYLPKTISGKTDRKLLVKLVEDISTEDLYKIGRRERSDDPSHFTNTEKEWVSIWSSILGLSPEFIGRYDSFFSLGGDSIVAIKLVAAARERGYHTTVQQVFEFPTIAELAQQSDILENEHSEIKEIERYSLLRLSQDEVEKLINDEIQLNGILPAEVEDIYPCAPLQEALFATSLRAKSNYLTQRVFVSDEVDFNRLKAAWISVIEANPILHTTIVSGKKNIDWQEVNVTDCESIDAVLQEVLVLDRERGVESGKLLTRFTVVIGEHGKSYFIWTIHHTLYDGWSMDLLLNDLVTAYQGQVILPKPSYSQFISYNVKLSRAESIAYWSDILDGVTKTCISKPEILSQKAKADNVITAQIHVDFTEFTAKHNITLATIINLAWAIVLKHHTGNSSVVFGTVNSGRSVPVEGIERICGPCISTLPLRVNFEEDSTLIEALARMHAEQLQQYRYQNIGLQDIHKHCIANQKESLFDTLLVIQNLGVDDSNSFINSIGLTMIESSMPADYPLVLDIFTGSKYHELSMAYDDNWVSHEEAKWILEHLKTSLERIVTSGDTRVNDFSIISQSEYELLNKWSGGSTKQPHDGCIHQLFEEQALCTPNNIAVQFEASEFVTYSELNNRANRIAHYLRAAGVVVESLVPLCFDKSTDMIVAMLAVLKAGGAYVPMDPSNPDERNHFIIQETKAAVVLGSSNYRSKFAELDVKFIDSQDPRLLEQPDENLVVEHLHQRNLCYVLYTSGSTGAPKGVMLEHAAVVNFIRGQQDVFNPSFDDRILQFPSYTFDVSVVTIFSTLLSGSRICMASKESLLANLTQTMESMQVTMADFTPTVAGQIQPQDCPSLKKLICIGEMMTTSVRDIWAPHVQLSNGYGPTEAAVAVTYNHTLTTDTVCRNVGVPLPNNKIFILDSNLRVVPLGVVGELCISGVQLARGYLNRPDLTAKVFVENPVTPGERMYLTGDLARFNYDGSIEILGRKDNQIKLHGLRIELEEIEHIIHQQTSVANTCVLPVVINQETNHESLVAFIKFDDSDGNSNGEVAILTSDDEFITLQIDEIRGHISSRLPPYMMPSAFIPLTRMPINVSGKTDRKLLLNLVESMGTDDLYRFGKRGSDGSSSYFSETETVWLKLWSSILGLSEEYIGRNDSFFSLGGDSIVAIKLVAAARERGYDITVQKVFEYPTIAKLSQQCEPTEDRHAVNKEIERYALLGLNQEEVEALLNNEIQQSGISPDDVEDIYPCSPLQEALFAIGMNSNSDYLAQRVFLCDDDVDFERLKAAWISVIEANSILRTTVIFTNSGYSHLNGLQVVLGKNKIDWREVNIADDKVIDEILEEVLAIDRKCGIDVGKLLTRFTVLRCANGRSHFIWTIHHALYDGWSMDLMVDDLVTAYQRQVITERPPYSQFINFHAKLSRGEAIKYWSTILDGVTKSFISGSKPLFQKSEIQNSIKSKINIDFSEVTTKYNITLATVINLAWAIVLKYHTGNSDVVFGTVNSGRSVPVNGIDRICGPCISTLPLRVNLEEELTLGELMTRMHAEQLQQYRYQNIGLQDIQKECTDDQTGTLFDTLLVLQHLGTEDMDPLESSIGLAEVTTTMPADYPLVVQISTGSDEHEIAILYNDFMVSHEDVERISEHLKTALVNIVTNTNSRVRDFSIISNKEYELLNTWSGKTTKYTHTGYLHGLFEEQVVRTPSNIAVQFENSEFVTYLELNSRANRLSHYLRAAGVGVETLVPLCLDKSVNMVVAMLAVLKAGGAYIPIDPESPLERIQHIVKEVRAEIVITTRPYADNFEVQHLILIDDHQHLIQQYEDLNPTNGNLSPENLCYVIYTSGSTGKPKGVMLEHAAVCNFISGQREIWNITEDDSVLQFSSYSFDASVLDIYFPLYVGARICLASKDSLLSSLEEIMELMNVTCANLTTTIASRIHPGALPSLKRLQLGGEMMNATVRDRWAPYIQLSNGYGPTEAAVAVAIHSSLDKNTSCNNIGKPIGSNKLYLVDTNLQQVPLGVVGELCISGSQLARGYLNQPELTNESFVVNPFEDGTRLYRTGDLARFNMDGSILMIGRKDNQIKFNGLRIELDEIDHALHLHRQVSRACTLPLVVDMQAARKALVAFISFNGLTEENSEVVVLTDKDMKSCSLYINEIQVLAQKTLPHYMVPTIWIPLNRMPTNSSEKIDRNALSDLFIVHSSLHCEWNLYSTRAQPENDVERCIQQIWANVLGMPAETIGIHDTFRSLGGDSILAIQINSMCRKSMLQISVQSILQHQTISKLAEQAMLNSSGREIKDDVVGGLVELTPNQRMFLGMQQTNVNHFNQAWLLRVREKIDIALLRNSIHLLIKAHDIFRARFEQDSGKWQLRVYPISEVLYNVEHRYVESVEEVESHVHELQRSLDIINGPLFRFALYNIPNGEQLLFMTVHHYVIDLVSWQIIWDDLEQLLQGQECDYRSISFMKWSNMLADYSRTLDSTSWPDQTSTEPLQFEPDMLDRNTMGTTRLLSFKLDSYFSKLFANYCEKTSDVSILDFIIGSLAQSYCAIFGKKSMSVALELHGRQPWNSSIDISRTVGWFTAIYPVVVSVEEEDTIIDIIRQVVTLQHQIRGNEVNYGLLRYSNEIESSKMQSDPLQITLGYMPKSLEKSHSSTLLEKILPDSEYSFNLESISPEFRRQQIFNCMAHFVDDQFKASILYSEELHTEKQVQLWLESWESSMVTAIVSISRDPYAFSILSASLEKTFITPEKSTEITDMAARYVKARRQVQSEGPYYIHGYSFGGLVAFEVARQMEQQNLEVRQVTIIDTMAPRKYLASEESHNDLTGEEYFNLISQTGGWDLDEAVAQMISHEIESNKQLMQKYNPPSTRLAADIVLIKAKSKRETRNNKQACYGWTEYANTVTIHTVEAEHYELMFEPFVSKIAEYMQN
ncbi:hypothetical protein K7432_001523 [Basidiobolus ranarum]|uniref:Carrier domain-containing protein n=1 Tax=Basidiobolus ranarum TaxID=34480 RepID=A0ABR2W9E0_9FUNG